jgi:hypothetical protein
MRLHPVSARLAIGSASACLAAVQELSPFVIDSLDRIGIVTDS